MGEESLLMVLLIVTVPFLLNFSLWYVQKRLSQKGSDHPYHFGLINGIKKNKHRFVLSHPGMMGTDNYSYPQFFHWLLSFLPVEFIKRKYDYIGLFVSSLSLIIFLSFSYLWLNDKHTLGQWDKMNLLWLGLIFILTPFSWAVWNSKNSGISARGIGILLILVYQLAITYGNGSLSALIGLGFLSYFILITSQFAFQYVLFSSVLYALLLGDALFVIAPLLGIGLFFLIHTKVAIGFFKGQYWHKRFYSLFLADRFILKSRYSIWRDFVYDFYKTLKDKGPSGIIYIYHNPVLSIFICIPLLSLLFYHSVLNYQDFELTILNVHIIVALLLFFLTSFRLTRFLGEPERYVEFAIPFITVLGFEYLMDRFGIESIVILLVFQVVLLFAQFLLLRKSRNLNTTKDLYSTLREHFGQNMVLAKSTVQCPKIFSNNLQVGKYFIDEGFEVLWLLLSSRKTGGIQFEDLIAKDTYDISEDAIVNLINSNRLDWYIQDNSLLNGNKLDMSNAEFSLNPTDQLYDFALYEVEYFDAPEQND